MQREGGPGSCRNSTICAESGISQTDVVACIGEAVGKHGSKKKKKKKKRKRKRKRKNKILVIYTGLM